MDYKVISDPERSDFLFNAFGSKCVMFEGLVFDLMREWAKAYDGGYYDFRKYENGACVMVLREDGVTDVLNPENYYDGEMSWEALSLAVNACALNWTGMYDDYELVMGAVYEHPEREKIWKLLD